MSCSVVHSIFVKQQESQNQKLFLKRFMMFLSRILESYSCNCSCLKILFSLIFLLISKGQNLQNHCWFTKTRWKFLKNNFLPYFPNMFLSFTPRHEICTFWVESVFSATLICGSMVCGSVVTKFNKTLLKSPFLKSFYIFFDNI